MRNLDPWAERELAAQIAANSWSGRSRWGRVAIALVCTSPVVLVTAAIAYVAGPDWWWMLPVGFLVAAMLSLLPYVFAPEATIRLLFRAGYVSDEDARRPPPVP